MITPEQAEQLIGEILSSLGHVDFAYVVADICTLAGWDTEVGIGNPETVGDVVAMQSFPHPHTVSVVCQTDGGLTRDELADLHESARQDALLVVVAQAQPSAETIEFARAEGILLFSPYDLAPDIVSEAGIELINQYVGRDEELSTEFVKEMEQLVAFKQELEATDSRAGTGPPDLPQAGTRPIVQTADTRVGVYGIEYLMADGDIDVVLVAVRLEHATDAQFSPDEFTLETANRGKFTGAVPESESDVGQLVQKLASVIEPEWTTSTSRLPAGEIMRCLVLFEVAGDVELTSIKYRDLTVELTPPAPAETYQGLPADLCEPIGTLVNIELRTGTNPEDTVWEVKDTDLFSLSESEPTPHASSESATTSTGEPDAGSDVKTGDTVDSTGDTVDSEILSELENEFENLSCIDREAEYSFSGSGDFSSNPFDLSSGLLIAEVKYLGEGDYDRRDYSMELIGEESNDITLDPMREETPTTHKFIDNINSGTYILQVEDKRDGGWEIDIYRSPSKPEHLPIHRSGHGYDIIGPIAYSGFLEIEMTTCGTDRGWVKFTRRNGQRDTGAPSVSVDAPAPGDNRKSETEVASNKSGSSHYCFAAVNCNGKWEVEITEHDT